MGNTTILWLRHDLRLHDNPALVWATGRGAVIPIYIDDHRADTSSAAGGASRWWLHHALADHAAHWAGHGIQLIIRQGDPLNILQDVIRVSGANAVTWNRCYEPYARSRDEIIKSTLRGQGIEVTSHNASLLVEPWEVKTGAGTPFKVYTPFSKACFARAIPQPVPTPETFTPVAVDIPNTPLEALKLLPTKPDWSQGLAQEWEPTSKAAHTMLHNFLDERLEDYKIDRDRPDRAGTSRLSPYLHFGQISPRTLWRHTQNYIATTPEATEGGTCYQRELLWREFSYHLLYHFPDLPHKPFNARFDNFPWRTDEEALRRWQKGQTGYPIVDAGMRQLWQTGWMHNRVRMIVASFLVKDLLIPWQAGAAWFWDTLVDADLASNAASWQWVAGSGADAAPYFRIFNPTLQGKKFDPSGHYIRRYVPELAALSDRLIHEPWNASPLELRQVGIMLGHHYPLPMVDHAKARDAAMQAYRHCNGTELRVRTD